MFSYGDHGVEVSEAVEIARLRLQGLDQFTFDHGCLCFLTCSSFLSSTNSVEGEEVDQLGVRHELSPPGPLNDYRYLHVGVQSCFDCLAARWFPVLSLDTSEIDLHVATVAAFECVVKHSNIYTCECPRTFQIYIDGSGGDKNNPDAGTWAVAV